MPSRTVYLDISQRAQGQLTWTKISEVVGPVESILCHAHASDVCYS